MTQLAKLLLAFILLTSSFAQAADLIGEYCDNKNDPKKGEMEQLLGQTNYIGIKELKAYFSEFASSKKCYIFQANNKLTYVEEMFNAKISLSGIYRLRDNGNLIAIPGAAMKNNFDSVYIDVGKDEANKLIDFNKKITAKTLEMIPLVGCLKVVNDYDGYRRQTEYTAQVKRYPKTQDGFNSCIKDMGGQMTNMANMMNSKKSGDSELETIISEKAAWFSIVGNTLHKLDKYCNSTESYTKKGSKASAFVPYNESKQFCFENFIHDKCGGKEYNPKELKCENNILLSKCGNGWYNPAEQYCFKNAIKDKELTDSRDGKKYRIAKIGTQTWLAENLNYSGEDGYLGLCKHEKPENCEKYGRLYDWAEAVGVEREYNKMYWKDGKYWEKNIHQGICPQGWALPQSRDWQTLLKFVGGGEKARKNLMNEIYSEQELKKCRYEKKDDRGRITKHDDCPTNEYGFSATEGDSWWNASQTNNEEANYMNSNNFAMPTSPKHWTKQVRCIQLSENDNAAMKAREEEKKYAIEIMKSLKDADNKYAWAEAKKYCASKGWHLPTNEEWETISKILNSEESEVTKDFPEKDDGHWASKFWWSATEENADKAYVYEMAPGGLNKTSSLKEYQLSAICMTPIKSSPPSSTKSSAKSYSGGNSDENSIDLLSEISKFFKEGKLKFGVRLAYNASTVYFEGVNSELGHGAEAGIIANIPIPNTSIEISIGANGIYRKPDNKEYQDENQAYIRSEQIEYVASLPVFFKYNISNFYVQAGAQVDVPLKIELKTTNGAEETWAECPWRNRYDLGLALGLGWNINKNFALDVKMVGAVSEFNKEIGGYKLVQGDMGLSYFF